MCPWSKVTKGRTIRKLISEEGGGVEERTDQSSHQSSEHNEILTPELSYQYMTGDLHLW